MVGMQYQLSFHILGRNPLQVASKGFGFSQQLGGIRVDITPITLHLKQSGIWMLAHLCQCQQTIQNFILDFTMVGEPCMAMTMERLGNI